MVFCIVSHLAIVMVFCIVSHLAKVSDQFMCSMDASIPIPRCTSRSHHLPKTLAFVSLAMAFLQACIQ